MNTPQIHHLGTGDIMVSFGWLTITTCFEDQIAFFDFTELDEFATLPLSRTMELIKPYL